MPGELSSRSAVHAMIKKDRFEESIDENLQSATFDKAGGLQGWRRLKATGLWRNPARSAVVDGMFHSGPAAGGRAIGSTHGQTRGQPAARIGRANPLPGLWSRRIARQSGCRIHVFRAADLAGAGFRRRESRQHTARTDGVRHAVLHGRVISGDLRIRVRRRRQSTKHF